MQPAHDLSTPRRPLDIEDYIDIVRRHKGWIVGPAFAGLVIAVVVAFLWPDSYISEATIRVQPPLVPERYVPTNVNVDLSQRISSMAQAIEATPNLQNLILTHNLYAKERRRKPMLDVAEEMRKDIKITPVTTIRSSGEGRTPMSAFQISFEYTDRHKAQAVTADLVRAFMDQNAAQRRTQANATTSFLEDKWKDAKRELDALEAKLTEFRTRNAGRLPEQMQANLQTLHTLETQLSGVNEAISRAGQEKMLLESQVRIYKDQLSTLGTANDPLVTSVKSERLAQLEREITAAENQLTAMRERYKDTHPDVQALRAQIAVMKRNREVAMQQENEKKDNSPRIQNPNEIKARRDTEMLIASLQSQIKAKDLEIQERTREQQQLKSAIATYNARIQASPIMEGDYVKLTRDYQLAKETYDDLNNKKTQSEIATDLENRKQGELLEVLEDASLPETPAKPNRWLIVGAGLGVGLIAGIFVAGAREMKDTSLKSLKDARAYTNLPVLGTVPLLENDLVVRRKRRLAWLAWSVACMLGILAMSTSIYFYYSSRT